ncbi:MAG: hypothetical protein VKL98_03490 [Cyanobacteriota bacterium]|nr:hypothetical protein [Cyanobacteriota bacterium]
MLRKSLIAGLNLGLLLLTLPACTPSNPVAGPDTNPAVEALEGRSAYREVPLPPGDQGLGVDPQQIALETFGLAEPGEGNFSQTVEVLEQTPTQAVVTLLQTGLPDDSVEAMRYRMEFQAQGPQWQLVWVGRQVRCRPGRGSQDWSTDLCS